MGIISIPNSKKVRESRLKVKSLLALERLIMYSSSAFRWYHGNKTNENQNKLTQIIDWWKQLDGQNIQCYHITGIEQRNDTGEWRPIQGDARQFTIQNPELVNHAESATISFTKQGSSNQTIEAICIDFDLQNEFVIVYPPNSIERYIFTKAIASP